MTALEAAPSLDDDAEFAEFQGHLNLIFARARKMWVEAADRVHPELQPSGYKMLMFLTRVGSCNAHEIAGRFEMDKSVISRQVRMLEDLGLLESRPDDEDGRQRVLTATRAASEALAAVRAEHTNRLRTALAGLTREEIETTSKALRLLSEM